MMGEQSQRWRNRIAFACFVLGMLGTGIAITTTVASPTFPPTGGVGVQDSGLTITAESLRYSGLDTTGITLDVKNTDSVHHTGDVHVELVDSGGSTVTAASKSGVSFPGDPGVTTVSVTFAGTNVTTFRDVLVRIEETG